jgi:hypothetical protein
MLGLKRYGPYINRLLWDCMPMIRSRVLLSLLKGKDNPNVISDFTKLSTRTIRYQLEDLRLLEIIDANNKLCMQLYIPNI